ncbi:MAG TPA: GNAT family N-acetyltransferase [Chloroflexi bacterium]|nr:GNAT family N-acetyltransferase [Chloroflexota bacterium]HHW88957.1 GNAT family N-acetyltransferase [Chloroflexota bacterium]
MIEIRPLQPDQWELHKRLRLAALADAPYAFTTQLADAAARPDAAWAAMTAQRASDPHGVTYFAFVQGEPCAMAACVLTELGAEMLAVWVAPAHRQQGVGLALVDYARQWARARGVDMLVVGVYADNVAAVRFYARAGFTPTGVERFATPTQQRPILLMAMSLAPEQGE